MNILLVDDEKYQLETIKRGMKIHGHTVTTVESAEEALQELRRHPDTIQLVITDYLMTGMNGLNLLKAIRQDFGQLPVIMMTAYGDQNLVVEAMRQRCDDYIDKPFKPKDLLEQVDKIEQKMGRLIPFPGTYQPEPVPVEAAAPEPEVNPLTAIRMGWTLPVFKFLIPAFLFLALSAIMYFGFVLPLYQ